jgi:ribosome-associated heat shock protein Hsp15
VSGEEKEDRQRLDVWLWRARFAKTRAVAARLIAEGGVRLVRGDASKVADKPSQALALGDVLLIRQNGALREIRVEAFGARRGPPAEARALYEILPEQP